MIPGKNLSIKNTFILVFIALSLFIGIVISFISFSRGFRMARDAVSIMNRDKNEIAVQKVREFLAVPAGISAACSAALGNGFVDLEDVGKRERFFRGILEVHSGEISGIFFETPDGVSYGARINPAGSPEFIRPDGKGKGFAWFSGESGLPVEPLHKDDVKNSSLFRKVLENGEPVLSALYGQSYSGDPVLSAIHPVYGNSGKPLGVTGTRIPFSFLDERIKQTVSHERSFAAVFDRNTMTLLSSSSREGRYSNLIGEALNHYQSTGETDFLSETPDGQFLLFFSGYTGDGLDLAVLTALPGNLLAGSIKESARFSGLLLLLSQLISIVIYMKVAKRLLNPVTLLVRSSAEFAGGNLSARTPVVRDDEIGLIARAFNDMAATISSLFGNLERIVEERTVELQAANRELEQQSRETAESRNMLRLLLDSTGDAVFGIDQKGNCTFCNRSFLRIMGFESLETLRGRNMHSLIHHTDSEGFSIDPSRCRICLSLLAGENVHSDHEIFRRADGTPLEVDYHSYPQFLNGEIVGAVVSFTDNSERRKSRAKIDYLSTHDSLTGLHNRAFFERALKEADTESNLPVTVLFGDINGLKLTNDVFGHAAGDRLLVSAAELLKGSCRGKDVVARLGGDEFAVIMTNTGEEAAGRIIRRIKNDFADRKIIAIRGSISMGSGTKTDSGQDLAEAVQAAEESMYREKILYRKDIDSEMVKTIMETLLEKCPGEQRHAESVSGNCRMIGETLGMSEGEVEKLKAAGYLHDIGKVVLGQEYLNREDGLVEEEEDRKELILHPAAGYRILNLFDGTLEYAEWIFCHHEHWDGSGFPNGISGKDIPLQARILLVAEVWDRLRVQFKGSPGWEGHAVRELRRQAGTVLDPGVVDAFTAPA